MSQSFACFPLNPSLTFLWLLFITENYITLRDFTFQIALDLASTKHWQEKQMEGRSMIFLAPGSWIQVEYVGGGDSIFMVPSFLGSVCLCGHSFWWEAAWIIPSPTPLRFQACKLKLWRYNISFLYSINPRIEKIFFSSSSPSSSVFSFSSSLFRWLVSNWCGL